MLISATRGFVIRKLNSYTRIFFAPGQVVLTEVFLPNIQFLKKNNENNFQSDLSGSGCSIL